jgi:hypothetical protein
LQPRCHLQPEQPRGVAAAVAGTTRPASTTGHGACGANSRRGSGVFPAAGDPDESHRLASLSLALAASTVAIADPTLDARLGELTVAGSADRC